jgi:hypothetical protein
MAESMQLDCANTVFRKAGRPELATQRRARHMVLVVGGSEVRVRDQSPLHEGNIDFESGWDFARLVEALNNRVYFWPGTADSPIDYGLRHMGRYLNEGPVVVKVPCRRMFALNPNPLFCKFNSGSPRCTGGRKSPRGSATFQSHTDCNLAVSDIVEVTFEGVARLPDETELLTIGEWRRLEPTPSNQQQA